MVDYAASLLSFEPRMWRTGAKDGCFLLPSASHLRPSKRKYFHGSFKLVQQSTWKPHSAGHLYWRAGPCLKHNPLGTCVGSLLDPDGATTANWVLVNNQLLLMGSIFLTYMAGVIPLWKPNLTPWKIVLDENVVLESATSSGSARKNDDNVNLNCSWDVVKTKLWDSLYAVEQRSNLGNKVFEIEQQHAQRPLSLYAVSEGPKLRLLWASFQRLEEEVNNVLGNSETIDMDVWFTIFAEIIQKSCHPICLTWLMEELRLENNKFDQAHIFSLLEKLKEDDIILQNIKKSGKEDLYAELLYFLKFGSLRKRCYDQTLFILHGDSILEDLVITTADGVASVYLELISVDGNLSNEVNNLGLVMCNLSTRALQRLRNEVALNQWLYQNLEAVVSMYEDRFDLCMLQLKVIEDPSQNRTESHGWWKKLTLGKSVTMSSSLYYGVISQFSIPVKRTKELRALMGWRYYFSLYLELSDIAEPLIRVVINKVRNAISFFLVSLIGRSLGLIYTGIRQSLRWK